MPRKDKSETPDETAESSANNNRLLQLATEIVSSYVSHNQVPLSDMTTVIRNVHASLADLSGGASGDAQHGAKPAVSIKKSIGDDYIICLEDGKKLKMLKRYLRSHFKLSPDEYRAKWHLPRDYPMVAPAYARQRSAFAKKIGLGRVPGGAAKGRRRKA